MQVHFRSHHLAPVFVLAMFLSSSAMPAEKPDWLAERGEFWRQGSRAVDAKPYPLRDLLSVSDETLPVRVDSASVWFERDLEWRSDGEPLSGWSLDGNTAWREVRTSSGIVQDFVRVGERRIERVWIVSQRDDLLGDLVIRTRFPGAEVVYRDDVGLILDVKGTMVPLSEAVVIDSAGNRFAVDTEIAELGVIVYRVAGTDLRSARFPIALDPTIEPPTCCDTDDLDGDGVPNDRDCAPANPNIRGPSTYYRDVDGDGWGQSSDGSGSYCANAVPSGWVSNSADQCPRDSRKQTPGACGCGNAESVRYYYDSDRDGVGWSGQSALYCPHQLPSHWVASSHDECPLDQSKTNPGTCGCGVSDSFANYYYDSDRDGIGSGSAHSFCVDQQPADYFTSNWDNCPTDANASQADLDEDGLGDVCDSDDDGDGVDVSTDCDDRVAAIGAPSLRLYRDTDGDGYGEPSNGESLFCGPTSGWVTSSNDNCPAVANPDQLDQPDADGIGNVCDSDDDNDGASDLDDCVADDPEIGAPRRIYPDVDGDGIGQGSGIVECPLGAFVDFVNETDDNCPTVPNPDQLDEPDADGLGNLCDDDDDNDGINDRFDCDGGPLTWYPDRDGDGHGDANSQAIANTCDPVPNAAPDNLDCDDGDTMISPDASETCFDMVDSDCDGYLDAASCYANECGAALFKGGARVVDAAFAPTSRPATLYLEGLYSADAAAELEAMDNVFVELAPDGQSGRLGGRFVVKSVYASATATGVVGDVWSLSVRFSLASDCPGISCNPVQPISIRNPPTNEWKLFRPTHATLSSHSLVDRTSEMTYDQDLAINAAGSMIQIGPSANTHSLACGLRFDFDHQSRLRFEERPLPQVHSGRLILDLVTLDRVQELAQ